jgi:nucleotide-binding universal stress UspA family protein
MTVPFAHIACCVEYESTASTQVLATGRALRSLGSGGTLSVVHVVEPPIGYPGFPGVGFYFGGLDPGEVEAEALDWIQGMVGPDESPVILRGHAPAAVCDWASGADVDLLVIAATRGMVDRVILGSFASYLMHHAPCPVLLVRPIAPSDSASDEAVATHAEGAR